MFVMNNTQAKQNCLQQMSKISFYNSEVVNQLDFWDNPFRTTLAIIRIIPSAIILLCLAIYQDYIRPHIMIIHLRRYFSCVANLIWMRVVLIIFGCFRFQTENFRYFNRMNHRMTFKSGWVGVATHKNFLDYLYFSYLFNPVYVKIIVHKTEHDETFYYSPMTYMEALFAALSARGFDPLIAHSDLELKRIRKRKMKMQTIISECFQQMNGPILIMLPGICVDQQLKMNKTIGMDIFDNQRKFLRSGIAFTCETNINEQRAFEKVNRHISPEYDKIYLNQFHFIFRVCGELRINKISITAHELIRRKLQYRQQTLCSFIDECFQLSGLTIINKEYGQYLKEVNALEEKIKSEQNSQNNTQIKKKQF